MWTPVEHRDPVTGRQMIYARQAHTHASSPRLQDFRRCIRQQMEGKTFRSADPVENSRAVRQAMAQAARSCARGGGRHGM
jgi:hypothetical protein